MGGLFEQRVVAFAGIGRPEKFFSMLEAGGAVLVQRIGFPDHHPFGAAELSRLLGLAHDLEAVAVTTRKDFVRIPPALRGEFRAVDVSLAWADAAALEKYLDRAMRLVP